MSSYQGDFTIGSTFDFKFTSMDAGIPTSISGGFFAAYPDNSTTEIVSGITFTPDFDSKTGLNNVRIVMSIGNGYATGSNYDVVAISGTVGGKSLIGYAVGSFSIQNRYIVTGSSSDPWATALPGSYTASQAGGILASRMPTGTVIVGTNNDKTGYFLGTPQNFDLNGNVSGTITNVLNVINPIPSVGMVTGTVVVSSNLDKTGYALTSTEHTNIADALLKRDWNSVTGEAARSVLNALRKLRNKVTFNGTNTLTVTKEDDATPAYTQGITTDANQDPFKEVG